MSAVQIGASSRSAVGVHIDVYAARVHESCVADWRKLQDKVEQAVEAIRRLASSPDYSEVGREKAIKAARERSLDRLLQDQRATIATYRTRIAETEAAILPPLSPRTANDLPALLLEQEIRHHLKGEDPLKVQVRYIEAIERGDEQFVRAVEDAPAAFPMLTAEVLTKGREQKLQRSPQWETLKALREDLEVHTAILEAAEHDLKTAGSGA